MADAPAPDDQAQPLWFRVLLWAVWLPWLVLRGTWRLIRRWWPRRLVHRILASLLLVILVSGPALAGLLLYRRFEVRVEADILARRSRGVSEDDLVAALQRAARRRGLEVRRVQVEVSSWEQGEDCQLRYRVVIPLCGLHVDLPDRVKRPVEGGPLPSRRIEEPSLEGLE